ncbi:MAG: hypothetical protein A2607_01385 [Candidatus Vogelbacteria bacterium RIFOXYD1_FULL_42_15]|uniref:Uncharacterized protein n=1 Tax=Candidatus Vogelbacteria bacterium RIFOXYD1_FULL_42_15 TaxID=1802437 RepID=A0A1G2QDP3_9BACT|nr:MAG: hypothetical protein A2607_01385 [Candidatus Vogelbacteria bacterium RIFOXYD1_FULL_42_15]
MDPEKLDILTGKMSVLEKKQIELEGRLNLLEQGDHLVVSPKLEEINNPAEIILTESGKNLPLAPEPTKPSAVLTAEPTAIIEQPEAPDYKRVILMVTIVTIVMIIALGILFFSFK